MRRGWPWLVALLLGCGEPSGGGGGDATSSPTGRTDLGAGGSPSPAEDAFVPRLDRGLLDAVVPLDTLVVDASIPADTLAPPDASNDAGVRGGGPSGGGFAAGAGPLRSARYRLEAVVGPAGAVGLTLSSNQYRLESGPILWLPPAEAGR